MKALLASLLMFLVCTLPSMAQKANIGFVYPAAVSCGSEVTLEVGGQGISGSTGVMISGDGIRAEVLPDEPEAEPEPETFVNKKGKTVTRVKKVKKAKRVITGEDNLQLEDRVKIRLKISPSAKLGMRDIKLVSAKGAISNRLYLEVVPYRCVNESEDNGTLATANDVGATPVVINGQVERGGRDSFSFEAKEGQKIVAEVVAKRFVPFLADAVPGWFQAVLTLYDENGREVAYSDDYNLDPDPVIRYTIPKDGRYTLQIQDSIFRGREDFVYRIAVGEIPFVHAIFPLGGAAGSTVDVELMGDNLKSYVQQRKLGGEKGRIEARIEGAKGGFSNAFDFEISDKQEIVLPTDNGDERKHATHFTSTELINARIEHERDQDWYVYTMNKGEQRVFEITARRLGSPLDAKMNIYDAAGNLLDGCDDFEDAQEGMITHHADPQLSFTAPATGRYFLRVTDTQNKFGPDFGYRLSSKSCEPSYQLRVEPSAISIPQGGTTEFTVFVNREQGFDGAIDLALKNIPEGFVLSDTHIAKHADKLKITITAPEKVKLGKYSPMIEGVSTLVKGMGRKARAAKAQAGAVMLRVAEPVEAMLQAFYITHLLPTQEFRMDVIPAQEFRIEVPSSDAPIQLKGGVDVKFTVKIHRQKGFNDPIQLLLKGLPKTMKSNSPVNVAEGQTEAIFTINCETWARSRAPSRLSITGVVGAKGVQSSGKGGTKLTGSVMVNSPLFIVHAPKEAPNAEKKKNHKDK